jgi:hypothetical protein
MPPKATSGPAALLGPNSSWYDEQPVFATQDMELAYAAKMLCKITRELRARQGERGFSDYELGWKSGIRRQTVAAVLQGRSWADSRTLGQIAFVLGMELTVQDIDLS